MATVANDRGAVSLSGDAIGNGTACEADERSLLHARSQGDFEDSLKRLLKADVVTRVFPASLVPNAAPFGWGMNSDKSALPPFAGDRIKTSLARVGVFRWQNKRSRFAAPHQRLQADTAAPPDLAFGSGQTDDSALAAPRCSR